MDCRIYLRKCARPQNKQAITGTAAGSCILKPYASPYKVRSERIVKKLTYYLEKIQSTVGTILLIFLTIVVSLQVVSRFILKSPILWTEEGSRFIFFWVALMGASTSVYSQRHFQIEVFSPEKIKNRKLRLVLEVLPNIIILVFCLALTFYGWQYFMSGWSRTGIEIPVQMAWVFAALPIAGFTMTLYLITNILSVVAASKQQQETPSPQAGE